MNCAVHTDTPATAFCRTCGKALCENCKRDVMGAIYCEPCLAARLQSAPPPAAQAAAPGAPAPASPVLALVLGFIPGVGAMYNGQFAKAILHVSVFVMLIMAADNVSGLFGIVIPFWIFYMAFEAYKTAEARKFGLPLPDFLGIDRLLGVQEHQTPAPATQTPAASAPASAAPFGVPAGALPASEGAPPLPQQNLPTGAVVLIGLGVLFLLSNFGFFNMRHFVPLLFIGIGLWIAYKHSVRPRP